ncbi:ProQ/FinO family protein [Ideonella paludis]|uniref:Prop effector ProQ n=1 Tax=Ideonella paludis TaxID=1233411 RepID=A0ABS5DZW5_9BURK|nr:ProQ/FinO family protein [Ideonella paludis]MBQ0936684.1 prop effector ProQ [Ideonella paludis]
MSDAPKPDLPDTSSAERPQDGAAPAAPTSPVATPATEGTAAAPAAAGTPGMTAADCAQELKQRFPALFGGSPKPLKLKIQADIQERAPGVFTKAALSAFFRRFTGSTSYLIALTRARQRFDLDGQPAGELAQEHRDAAEQELARRRNITQERRAAEEEQRQQRQRLLRDFERTTLTLANFCALKGLTPEALEETLAQARVEAVEMAAARPAFAPQGERRPPQDRRPGPGPRRDGPHSDRPRHAGPRNGPGNGPNHGPRGPRRDGDAPRNGPRRDGGRPGPANQPRSDRPAKQASAADSGEKSED